MVSPRNENVNETKNSISQKVQSQIKSWKSTNFIRIMILMNLSPSSMCNKGRLIIEQLKHNLFVATIIAGSANDQLAQIPRIPMTSTDPAIVKILFESLQFPVEPSFAFALNKSQGWIFGVCEISKKML